MSPWSSSAWILLVVVASSVVVTTARQWQENDPSTYFLDNPQPYLEWMAEHDIAQRYGAATFLPSQNNDDGVALHWQVVDDHVHVALVARASGWLAFGLSQAGGMLGADIVHWERAKPETLTDAYVVETRYPRPDDCGQDWILVDSDTTRDGFLMWEGRRPLTTGDAQDFDIHSDATEWSPSHRVIAAWGDDDRIGHHGHKVARGVVRFHQTAADRFDFDATMEENAMASFSIQAADYTIPPIDTQYKSFCLNKADILEQGIPDKALHVVGFEPIITPGNEKYVHHFVVTATSDAADDACSGAGRFIELAYGMSGRCGRQTLIVACLQSSTSHTRLLSLENISVWTPGEQPFALPDLIGGPLFGSGFSAFSVQIHYNNPCTFLFA